MGSLGDALGKRQVRLVENPRPINGSQNDGGIRALQYQTVTVKRSANPRGWLDPSATQGMAQGWRNIDFEGGEEGVRHTYTSEYQTVIR